MKNNLLQNIDEKILKQIIFISENYEPAYYGGSISLNALGIIDRQVNDIDVCVHHSETISAKKFFNNLEKDKLHIFKFDKAHRDDKHIRYTINNIEHCLFLNNDLYCVEIELKQDLKIKVSLPQIIIEAKRQYINEVDGEYIFETNTLLKHKLDIKLYKQIEKNILRQIKIKILSDEFKLISTITHQHVNNII
jgi:hypothetical protein